MSDVEAWLRFALVVGISSRARLELLRQFGDPAQVLRASSAMLALVLSPEQVAAVQQAGDRQDWPELAQHLDWLEGAGNGLLTLADSDFPSCLLDLPDVPIVLFYKGNTALLRHPALAMVGSRQATPPGLDNAESFAADLSDVGVAIVSGLAAGIDAAAHRGGLRGRGSTIAVVGTGLDRIYPASNRDLAHAIAQQGLILSEFPLGFPPKAEHFPRRNRLIAALGLGCLVVEAAMGSGSLITARQAADLGREVFAIPGSIHSPQSKGCHRLIKEGAKLVESARDIFEELALQSRLSAPLPFTEVEKPVQTANSPLLERMGWEPVDIETLSQRSGLCVNELGVALLDLELSGLVVSLPGNRFLRKA